MIDNKALAVAGDNDFGGGVKSMTMYRFEGKVIQGLSGEGGMTLSRLKRPSEVKPSDSELMDCLPQEALGNKFKVRTAIVSLDFQIVIILGFGMFPNESVTT